jgi:hypothetical protein
MDGKRITPEMLALVPELAEWGDTPIGIEEWIGGEGNYSLAIGYARLFWPRIVQFGEYVLLEKSADAEAVRAWEAQVQGDRRAIEAVLNHVHMIDVHPSVEENSESQLIELGRVMRDMLEAKLKWQFPDLRFAVVFDETPSLDPVDYEVTFWQARDED